MLAVSKIVWVVMFLQLPTVKKYNYKMSTCMVHTANSVHNTDLSIIAIYIVQEKVLAQYY